MDGRGGSSCLLRLPTSQGQPRRPAPCRPAPAPGQPRRPSLACGGSRPLPPSAPDPGCEPPAVPGLPTCKQLPSSHASRRHPAPSRSGCQPKRLMREMADSFRFISPVVSEHSHYPQSPSLSANAFINSQRLCRELAARAAVGKAAAANGRQGPSEGAQGMAGAWLDLEVLGEPGGPP